MNRIWISRESSLPIREQLGAQLLFGIVSRRYAPGERLPSVRDLARRLKIHANTVSAAYQDLAARGWVERRPGSGVFVNDVAGAGDDEIDGIDEFARAWIEDGMSRGYSAGQLAAAFGKAQARIAQAALDSKPRTQGLLVVHPDRELAAILAAEIAEALGSEVPHAGADAAAIENAAALQWLTTTSGAAAVSRMHGDGHRLISLKSMDEVIAGTLAGIKAPAGPSLIGIVSRSATILNWASLLIPALGLRQSDLIQRNPADSGWRRGLDACDFVVADVVAARELPGPASPHLLRLVAADFLRDLQGAAPLP